MQNKLGWGGGVTPFTSYLSMFISFAENLLPLHFQIVCGTGFLTFRTVSFALLVISLVYAVYAFVFPLSAK